MRTGRDWITVLGLTVVALAAAILSFSTLMDLAVRCGTPRELAWLLPVAVDVAAVVATRLWLTSPADGPVRAAARWTALGAIGLTVAGNAAEHVYAAFGIEPRWWAVVIVGAVPAVVLGRVAHVAALMSTDRTGGPDRTGPDPDRGPGARTEADRLDDLSTSEGAAHGPDQADQWTDEDTAALASWSPTDVWERYGQPVADQDRTDEADRRTAGPDRTDEADRTEREADHRRTDEADRDVDDLEPPGAHASDEDLLAYLVRLDGPLSRNQVMRCTGVGATRARKLLDLLDGPDRAIHLKDAR